MIHLTDQPIDVAAAVDAARSPEAGAVVVFLGTVRGSTNGRETQSLLYECYDEMAASTLGELEAEARRRWALCGAAIIHRTGRLRVGETSVVVALSAAHRQAAFEAAAWLIDRIKQVVPIWKQEHYADGSSQWKHGN
jgi:molybdopterin synthase catalytic subunit